MDRDTSEYSSSKAPETQEHAEEGADMKDPRLIPGGAQPRTPFPQGMPALDQDTPATDMEKPGQPRQGATRKDEVVRGA